MGTKATETGAGGGGCPEADLAGEGIRPLLAASSLRNPTHPPRTHAENVGADAWGGAVTWGIRRAHSQRAALGCQWPGVAVAHARSRVVWDHAAASHSFGFWVSALHPRRDLLNEWGPTWRAGVRVPSTSNRQRTRSFLRAPSAVTAMVAVPGAQLRRRLGPQEPPGIEDRTDGAGPKGRGLRDGASGQV